MEAEIKPDYKVRLFHWVKGTGGDKQNRRQDNQDHIGAFHLGRQYERESHHGRQNQIDHAQVDQSCLEKGKRIGDDCICNLELQVPSIPSKGSKHNAQGGQYMNSKGRNSKQIGSDHFCPR